MRNEPQGNAFAVIDVKRHSPRMTQADQYRSRSAELTAKARTETDPTVKAEYEALALGYRRLAEQADRNSQTDIVYETPRRPPGVPPQQPRPGESDE